MKRIFVPFLALGILACDDAPDETPPTNDTPPIEIEGHWQSEFGEETIAGDTWNGYCEQRISSYDNDLREAIIETIADDVTGCQGGYSRVVWTEIIDDSFYYCVEVFGQSSADEAQTADGEADPTDLDAGCSGYPWSALVRQ